MRGELRDESERRFQPPSRPIAAIGWPCSQRTTKRPRRARSFSRASSDLSGSTRAGQFSARCSATGSGPSARVQQQISKVYEQIRADDDARQDHHDTHDDGAVALDDGVNGQRAESRPTK